jgi:hypothetical protein
MLYQIEKTHYHLTELKVLLLACNVNNVYMDVFHIYAKT